MVRCFLAEFMENTIFQFKGITFRFISHHKIFIRIILVELDKFYPAFILFTHNRICQSFGGKCFSDTGSTLENDILLFQKHIYQAFILFLRHINFFQKIFF